LDCSSGVKPVRLEGIWQLDGSNFVQGRHWISPDSAIVNQNDALTLSTGNQASQAWQQRCNGKVLQCGLPLVPPRRQHVDRTLPSPASRSPSSAEVRAIVAQVDRLLGLHAFTFIASVTLRVILCRNLFSRRCRLLPLLLGLGELLHLPQDETPINPGDQSKKDCQQHLPAKGSACQVDFLPARQRGAAFLLDLHRKTLQMQSLAWLQQTPSSEQPQAGGALDAWTDAYMNILPVTSDVRIDQVP
jgi:hypothetical protein